MSAFEIAFRADFSSDSSPVFMYFLLMIPAARLDISNESSSRSRLAATVFKRLMTDASII